jgi:uncharacterized protein YggU (UPF0235/DUF167 family)
MVIGIKVTTNASKNELLKIENDCSGSGLVVNAYDNGGSVVGSVANTPAARVVPLYKARIQSSPVDGKANAALIELLAKEFNVPKSNVKILRGKTSRNKIVEVKTVEVKI